MLCVSKQIDTDILVIGGGGAACTAAVAAARGGAKVVMACKGKTGSSGNTIMIGGSYGMDGESAANVYHVPGADPTFTKEDMFRAIIQDGFNLSDQKIVRQFVEDSPKIVYEVKTWGEEVGQRFGFYPPGNWDVTGRSFGRALLNGIRKTDGITVYDDILITDLIKNGEKVTGAIGIDILNGCLVQFNAKATILGTGGFQPFTLKSTNSDCTGDGQAMAYRAGAKLADMEFILFMVTAIEPKEYYGSILPALCTFRAAFDYDAVDVNGDIIEIPQKLKELESVSEISKVLEMYYYGKVFNSGAVSPGGGFYFDFHRFSDEEIDVMFEAVMDHFDGYYPHGYYHAESITKYRDYIKKHRRVEVGFGGEYNMGGIHIDEDMATDLPGLYAAGEVGCGAFGANRVADAVTEMIVQGYKAGEVAAERTGNEALVYAEEGSVKAAIRFIEEIFEGKDGITVGAAKQKLQTIADSSLKLLRNEETLSKGVRELEELDEQLGNVTISSSGLVYNRELMEAIQLKNLGICTRISAKMALERKESRGVHLREDHPYIDNAEWQVRLFAEMKDGKDVLSRHEPVIASVPRKSAEKIDYGVYVMTEDLGMRNQEDAGK